MYVPQLVSVKNVNVLIANAILTVSVNLSVIANSIKSALGQIF